MFFFEDVWFGEWNEKVCFTRIDLTSTGLIGNRRQFFLLAEFQLTHWNWLLFMILTIIYGFEDTR